MDATTYFDVDGTLLHRDERDDDITGAAAAFDLAIDEAAIPLYKALVDQYFRRNASDPYCQGIERWVERYGFDVDPEAFAEELKRTQIEDTRAHDGLRDALDRLADRATLGVLTNGAGDMQRGKFDRHDLSHLFETALISGEADPMKPRDGFSEAARERLSADRHVYVGDRSPLADLAVESVRQLPAATLFESADSD